MANGTNWFMGTAQHKLAPGTLTARLMLSLEPATISHRRYPLLFQQGETAFGRPIEDGQHPHDFLMELAALYDLRMGESNLLSLYFAPVGDPAIGPAAYAHRASASENPVGTLGHHQQDSTHIADEVVTVGLTHGRFRIEGSGFHGREPDEFRWDLDTGKIDSWSTRLTFQPGKNWSGQVSYARIASPEMLFPNEDQARLTASVMYNRRLHDGNWASTMLWGRTRSIQDNSIFNSYLLESTVRFRTRHSVWTRVENGDRSNELVFGENPIPPGFQERAIGRVQSTPSATIAISILFRISDPPLERNAPRTGSPRLCEPFMAHTLSDLWSSPVFDPFPERADRCVGVVDTFASILREAISLSLGEYGANVGFL